MGNSATYSKTTHSIRVSVLSMYLKNQSIPEENVFVWAYHVSIENNGSQAYKLLTRYWKITDAMGRVQEVRGDGVIGEQPIIQPGENFEYTSSVTLSLSSGVMVGSYQMQSPEGDDIDVQIPLFSLDTPEVFRTIH